MRLSDEIIPLPATDEVEALMHNLRARDKLELRACGYNSPAQVARTFARVLCGAVFLHDWRPAAVVAFAEMTPSTLSAALLASDDWPKVARRVMRYGQRTLKPMLLGKGYKRAECRTIAGHDDAIRFLKRFGFVEECRVPLYGRDGETFVQFAWRLCDHENKGDVPSVYFRSHPSPNPVR